MTEPFAQRSAACRIPICDEAAADKQLTKTIARYGRVDLLCIDLCRPRNYAGIAGCHLAMGLVSGGL